MPDRLRWGILGTGNIARQFCAGLATCQSGVAAAVGSRQTASAQAFARDFAIPAAHGSYTDLIADPAVDVVYNSLPNSLHHDWTIAALRAGKHVLCEKPIAMNAAEAANMFHEADRAGRVLVEAFMYRSHPQTLCVEQALAGGAIGELKLIRTSFCYRTRKVEGNIRFDPALGGGALMDIGCYCVNFSRHFAGGEPAVVHGVTRTHSSGVDDLAAGTLLFPSGVIATFSRAMGTQANNAAYLCGSEGYIEIPVPWKPPAVGATFVIARQTPPKMDAEGIPATPPRQVRKIDAHVDLFGIEADDFAAAVAGDRPPRISAPDSIGNMRVLDELRSKNDGMTNPGRMTNE